MDQKLTTKTSHAEFPSLNKFGCTLFAELCGRDYVKLVSRALSFQIVLNTQKNPNLNRATQKRKRNQKFQPPEKYSDHPCHLMFGVHLTVKDPKRICHRT